MGHPRGSDLACVALRSGREVGAGVAQQADEAHEALLEADRKMAGGAHRGSAVIVWVPASPGASQLIRGVTVTFKS